MLGALTRYIANADPERYQPMNAAFGLLPEPPSATGKKKQRREARSAAALAALRAWMDETGEGARLEFAV